MNETTTKDPLLFIDASRNDRPISDANALMLALGLKGMLKLTLEAKWFDIMMTGEKQNEFRKPSDWMITRLVRMGRKRDYDLVKFTNGYAKNARYFICEYKGFFFSNSDHSVVYGKHKVDVKKGDIIIKLGQILKIKE